MEHLEQVLYICVTIKQQSNNNFLEMASNIEKIKTQLNNLSEKISGEDKLDAALELGCHTETINRYLRGEVRKEAFGLQLLGFFKNKIAKREKALA